MTLGRDLFVAGTRQVLRGAYRLPGARLAVREAARFAAQRLPLSWSNRWRMYNLLAEDALPASGKIDCDVWVPGGRRVRLKLDFEDYLSRIWYFLGYRGYEAPTTALVAELMRKHRYVFDVGANIGYYTLLMAALAEGGTEIHAFEPWREMFERLRGNLELNHFGSVRLNECAASDRDGEAELFLPSDDSWTTASLVPGFMTTDSAHPRQIVTTRLESYCERAGVPRIDLLRIDAEGFELPVLRGLGDKLWAWQPDVILEVLPGYDEALEQFFAGSRYRRLLITGDGLREVDAIVAHPQLRDYYLTCARD